VLASTKCLVAGDHQSGHSKRRLHRRDLLGFPRLDHSALGGYLWLAARRTRTFGHARRMSTIGLLMIIILFMGGFLTVGGDWFEMWRSVAWNGNEPAFRNSVLALFGVLCHIPSQH
jgi:predicted small integral membrane protein